MDKTAVRYVEGEPQGINLFIRFDIASGKDVKVRFMQVISKYVFILLDLCFLACMLLSSCSRKKMWVWKKKPTNTYLFA